MKHFESITEGHNLDRGVKGALSEEVTYSS